ncbi:DUF4381 domain-containing protein [Dyella flava]|uniref:DUF4381 domain-containing protein n=1 Tax=Dyella flava TaxID=1920170 RepID=A0ABS2K7S1_9GAMM|nr:DUF4381 domain-containing protein [Dyella flava]MBM7126949.1 DUF4381 domain-containing protein [Dyella flava]GLQ50290.1 hypothetical protein GCM10010872_17390 [Dyella flava]
MSGSFPEPEDGLTLRDIHMPPAPSWWPPAPGWWVLFGTVCLIVILAWLFYQSSQKKRMARQRILAEIEQLAGRHPDDDTAYAASLHQLLRRAARRYAADAHLTQGDRWRQVLARIPVDDATLDALMSLDARMYQPHADFDRQRVQAAAQYWLDAALRHARITEVGHA